MFEFVKSDKIKIELVRDENHSFASNETIADMLKAKNVFAYDVLLDGDVIGFAMFRKFRGGLFLWQYAIDCRYQGRGYGYGALSALIEKLRVETGVKKFYTTYTYGNEVAKHVYEKLGFTELDVVNEDGIHEVDMVLKVK